MGIQVLGMQSRHFIRPNNTDWRHNLFLEKAFSERQEPDFKSLGFKLRRSIPSWLTMNVRYIQQAIGNRLPFINLNPSYFVHLFEVDKIMDYDVIYSYGCFPSNPTKPVVWHDGPTDTELLIKRGVPSHLIKDEIECKTICASRAKLIAVSSDNNLLEFDKQFPGNLHKIVVLPFILSGVFPAEVDFVIKKQREERLNILFVGRQAKRKGLDFVIAAFIQLRLKSKIPLSLTIVSCLSDHSDKFINIPKSQDITWHKELAYEKIQGLMRESHILVMPSREETYGLVFVEAMAAGAVPIGPSREPQISLLGNGNRGLLCEITVEGVLNALTELVENQQGRETMALNGLCEFQKSFSEKSVMACYEAAFRRAVAP